MLSRRIWTIACWTGLALLAATAVWRQDPSIAIGVAVAAVWGLRTGFSGPALSRR
jgi:hypothetical protein